MPPHLANRVVIASDSVAIQTRGTSGTYVPLDRRVALRAPRDDGPMSAPLGFHIGGPQLAPPSINHSRLRGATTFETDAKRDRSARRFFRIGVRGRGEHDYFPGRRLS